MLPLSIRIAIQVWLVIEIVLYINNHNINKEKNYCKALYRLVLLILIAIIVNTLTGC